MGKSKNDRSNSQLKPEPKHTKEYILLGGEFESPFPAHSDNIFIWEADRLTTTSTKLSTTEPA